MDVWKVVFSDAAPRRVENKFQVKKLSHLLFLTVGRKINKQKNNSFFKQTTLQIVIGKIDPPKLWGEELRQNISFPTCQPPEKKTSMYGIY